VGRDASHAPADPLWTPTPLRVSRSNLSGFERWLEETSGRWFADYGALWAWSVDDLEGFWRAIWDYYDVQADGSPVPVLGAKAMPGAEWFPNARLSYAEHVFRARDSEQPAIHFASEINGLQTWDWGRLRAETEALAGGLRAAGVEAGDRVAAYLPNTPQAVAAFLACASIGAIWSCAAPEFGVAAVLDRFAQIEPVVLLAADGYRYGGRDYDRLPAIAELQNGLPTLRATVVYGHLDETPDLSGLTDATDWQSFGRPGEPLTFARLPFDHPLWILYSSGTTGLPKAIVHSQGGILLEHLKALHLHMDACPGDRILWFTTTGWMMWNLLVGTLLSGAEIVLYDGDPGYPTLDALWDLAQDAGVSTFGTSAAFLSACRAGGIAPREGRDLSALAAVGSTGSPLSPETFAWVYEQLGEDIWLYSMSGGTDVCSSFVGGVPTLPVYAGEIQARALGCDVQAFDEDGAPLVGEVGELVVTRPMPSMPTGLWGDLGDARLRSSYFEMYPGLWRHGDWIEITERGSAIITGRSDATINRGGVRIGTSEIYRAALAVPTVLDGLVVDISSDGKDWMVLFVVLADGATLDDALVGEIRSAIRTVCSPRHVPNEVRQIPEVPRTLSGKVLEVPVKRILMGADPDTVVSRDTLANPWALDVFADLVLGPPNEETP
jgi:acetoacetyl-CoA synthetase